MSQPQEEYPYKNGPSAWEEFGQSSIWADIRNRVLMKIRESMQNADQIANTHEQDVYYKGVKAALVEVLDLPDEMMNETLVDMEEYKKHIETITGLV
tara:strand:- start:461 stop:751 length:291 start_codon:yes stop_codon:yes gene_type:complete